MSLLVYSASAGSGKTYTLALKYICMSLQSGNPNNFSHILAVTFTNKATTEMKERILSQFYNLAMGGLDEGFLDQVMSITHLTKTEVSERAKATLYAIMHDYDSFRVETIDSFFQSLLSNLAHELKLPRSFKVDLDDSLIILTAINNLLLSLDKRGNKELVNAVMGYMRNNVENDKGWNFTSSLNNFAKDNIFRDIYANNAEIIEEATNDADFIGKTHEQLRERMDDIEQQLNSLAEELETVADAIEEDIISNKRNIYSYIKKLRNRSLYKEEPSAYIKKAIDCSDTLLKKSQKNREQYVPLAENVSECILKVEKARVALTPIYNTCLLINKNLDNISMLGHIGREVNSVTNENGTFLLGRTPQLFSQMVGSNDASFVFERDGNTFDHVMIDEFQDTSRMQWHNFKNLLFENLATNQESMLVGDIKQSIYRWRGGDWNILYNIKRYFPKAHVEPKVDNFRSLPIIVKFNNAFFVKAATMLDGTNWDVPNNWQNAEGLVTEDILQRYSPTERNNSLVSILNIYKDIEQTPRSKEHGGYVRIAINDKDVSDDEVIEQMYEQMVLLHSEQGVPYDKMLVLVRKNSQAAQIINYFSANHPDCPITSDEAFKYVSSSMIMTIIYVLKFMANSNQNELALSLFSLHYDNLIEASVNKELYNETKEQFIGLLHDEVQTKQWLRTPLYELIRQLCETLHFSEIDNKCHLEQSAYLFGFMDEVLDFLANNPSDVELFLNYWDEKLSQRSIVANTANAIHVITIHKAKGLEAHTVFIPFCKGQMDEVRGTIWCNLMGENIEDGLLNDTLAHIPLIPVTGADKNSGKNSLFARFYKEEQQQQLIESLNSWYVAFTRARNNLFIWNIKEESVKGQYPFPLIDAFIHNRQPEVDLSNSKKKGN